MSRDRSQLVRRTLLATILVIAAMPVLYFGAVYTVQPTFYVEAQSTPNGEYRLIITPNFVVHSIHQVKVSDATGELASRTEPFATIRDIVLPKGVRRGTQVIVECELIYDRPMPLGATVSKPITLP